MGHETGQADKHIRPLAVTLTQGHRRDTRWTAGSRTSAGYGLELPQEIPKQAKSEAAITTPAFGTSRIMPPA